MTIEENARLEASIADAITVQQQFFHNQFNEATARSEKMLETRGTDACSILYIKFQTFSSMTLKALMTFDKDIMNETLVLADELLSICSSLGAQVSIGESLSSFFGKNYNKWSEVRLHAHVMRCHVLFFKTALMVCSSGTDFTTIVKACVYSRESFKGFEEAIVMSEQKKWTNQKLKEEFISSSKFGLGAYKLYMSLMPDKVLNMLEWCGFSNISESEGLRLLEESGSGKDFFAIMAQMTPLNYFYIFQTQFGVLGERKTRSLDKSKMIMEKLINQFPGGMFFRYLKGKELQFTGELVQSCKMFSCGTGDWETFKHGCHWELYWSNGLAGNWQAAAESMKILVDGSFWSPAVINYLYAIVLLKVDPEGNKNEARELLDGIEGARKRIAGKSVPDEKYCARKAAQYLEGKTNFELAFYEAAYIFNYLKITNSNSERAAAILDEIEDQLTSVTTHDIPICKFLQAVFKGQLGQVHDALEIFETDLDIMKDNGNLWLYPAANLEYGNMLRLEGSKPEEIHAKFKIAKERTHHSFESRLHYRIHGYSELV